MVSAESSENDGGGRETGSPPIAYTEKLKKACPYYMSLGMSYDEYWNGDPEMARYYREADQLRRERKNEEMWWQGLYVYEAICCASPLFQAFAKKGTKARPYTEQPHPVTRRTQKREKVQRMEKGDAKAKQIMEMFMASNNARLNKKKEAAGKEVNVNG